MDSDVNEANPDYFNPETFSDPETRELAEVLRRLERAMPSDRPVDWQESRRWHIETLEGLAESSRNERFIDSLDGVEFKVGGDEHVLFRVETDSERIYKATYEDSFGCCSAFDAIDQDLTGRHFNATLNEDPRFYLRRWILLNSLGDYKTRYEGILPPERKGWFPRICVSQPWIEGENPSFQAISAHMESLGFLEVSRDAFYLPALGVILTDNAPRNMRLSKGSIIPFDAIAEIASPEVKQWITRKFL